MPVTAVTGIFFCELCAKSRNDFLQTGVTVVAICRLLAIFGYFIIYLE